MIGGQQRVRGVLSQAGQAHAGPALPIHCGVKRLPHPGIEHGRFDLVLGLELGKDAARGAIADVDLALAAALPLLAQLDGLICLQRVVGGEVDGLGSDGGVEGVCVAELLDDQGVQLRLAEEIARDGLQHHLDLGLEARGPVRADLEVLVAPVGVVEQRVVVLFVPQPAQQVSRNRLQRQDAKGVELVVGFRYINRDIGELVERAHPVHDEGLVVDDVDRLDQRPDVDHGGRAGQRRLRILQDLKPEQVVFRREISAVGPFHVGPDAPGGPHLAVGQQLSGSFVE